MKNALKWTGIGLGSIVLLLAVAVFVASQIGNGKIHAVHDVPVAALAVSADSASVANGAHLAAIYGCTDCHGADLAGQVMSEEGPFRLVAANLTPAGVGGQYGVEDWDRAIRHGVGADGTALVVMPSAAYHGVSDEEAADLIAYLQSIPPVERDLPPMEFRFMGRVLAAGPLGIGKGINPDPTPATAPAPGATVAYGRYVAEMMCAYCHGPGLTGAEPEQPGAPYVPDLRPAGQWEPAQFHTTLTTGVTPAGRELDPTVMPWTATAAMTPDEREGIRLYIASLGTPATASAGE